MKEHLSLSQWLPQAEYCTKYQTKKQPALPVHNGPVNCCLQQSYQPRLKSCSFYDTFSKNKSSCRPFPMLYNVSGDCFRETPQRPSQIPGLFLPPVPVDLELINQKRVGELTKNELVKHLESGDLIVSAKSPKVIEYLIQKLKFPGGNGYPDFYDVDGAVLVLQKSGNEYYYMIDYPVKYTPANMSNYVNKTGYTDYAHKAWDAGRYLLESFYPVVIFRTGSSVDNSVVNSPPKVTRDCPQSRWGVPYGCGNWTHRV